MSLQTSIQRPRRNRNWTIGIREDWHMISVSEGIDEDDSAWTTLLGQQFCFNLIIFFFSVVSLSIGLLLLYSYYHIKYYCPQASVHVCKSIRNSAFMVLHMKKRTFICLWSHPCSPTSQLPGPFHWKTEGDTLGTKLFAHLIYGRKHKLVCVYKFNRNSCGYSFTVPL